MFSSTYFYLSFIVLVSFNLFKEYFMKMNSTLVINFSINRNYHLNKTNKNLEIGVQMKTAAP